VPSVRSEVNYCKALNVGVPFISRISQAKQNREIKGRQYRYLVDNLDVDKLCLTHTKSPGTVFYLSSTASNAQIMAEKYHSSVVFA